MSKTMNTENQRANCIQNQKHSITAGVFSRRCTNSNEREWTVVDEGGKKREGDATFNNTTAVSMENKSDGKSK